MLNACFKKTQVQEIHMASTPRPGQNQRFVFFVVYMYARAKELAITKVKYNIDGGRDDVFDLDV